MVNERRLNLILQGNIFVTNKQVLESSEISYGLEC